MTYAKTTQLSRIEVIKKTCATCKKNRDLKFFSSKRALICGECMYSGEKYNKLTIKKAYKNDGKFYFICLCDCGKRKVVRNDHLLHGFTKSCGCMKKESAANRRTQNGLSNTREYKTWKGMMNRCYRTNDPRYKDYGGRGITVCKEWHTFSGFLVDMGTRPKNKSLDRIDNKKGYSESNCKWSTPKEQQRNTRRNLLLPIKGTLKPLSEVAEMYGLLYSTLSARIYRGWSVERAVETPVRERS